MGDLSDALKLLLNTAAELHKSAYPCIRKSRCKWEHPGAIGISQRMPQAANSLRFFWSRLAKSVRNLTLCHSNKDKQDGLDLAPRITLARFAPSPLLTKPTFETPVNKSELITHIALKSDISKAAAGRALAGVIEAVSKTLKRVDQSA